MTRPPPDLYLITPVLDDPQAFAPALEEACRAGPVMAVLLRLAAADERTLVNRVKTIAPLAQAEGAAVILADPGPAVDLATVVTRGGADGAHASDPERLRDLCRRLKEGRNVGAGGLRTKHDAMVAGEIGVDYVLFGEPGPDAAGPAEAAPALDRVAERASWWAEIFQTPCVVHAPTLRSVPALAATGAEFVALGEAVWAYPAGPAEAVRDALDRLRGEVRRAKAAS